MCPPVLHVLTVQQVSGRQKTSKMQSQCKTMDFNLQKSAALENKLMKKTLCCAVNKLAVNALN